MSPIRTFLGVFLLVGAVRAYGNSSVLIYQDKLPAKNSLDTNVAVSDYIAQQLDNDGRLVPIEYSIADPVFRAATLSGKLKNIPDHPKLSDVLRAGADLHADYVLLVEATLSPKAINSKTRLYRDGRQIWKDTQTVGIDILDPSKSDEEGVSVARTIVFRMNAGPLRGIASRPKTTTPPLAEGQAPVINEVPISNSGVVSDVELQKEADAFVASGKASKAILLMRDAVDQAPFDSERRLALINLLLAENAQSAAETASEAANLMPEKTEFWEMAARAWLRAGHPEEAQKDLNEAVARDPNGSGTRLLLAEVNLQRLAPEVALDHLNQAIKTQDSAKARFYRAVCRALLGGADGMQTDLAEAAKLEPKPGPDEVAARYEFAADILDRSINRDTVEVRSLSQKIVVKPKDKSLLDEIDAIDRLLQSRTALLTALVPPDKERGNNDRRLLVARLVAQCISDIRSFSDKGDGGTLSDASINLSEAFRQMDLIKADSK